MFVFCDFISPIGHRSSYVLCLKLPDSEPRFQKMKRLEATRNTITFSLRPNEIKALDDRNLKFWIKKPYRCCRAQSALLEIDTLDLAFPLNLRWICREYSLYVEVFRNLIWLSIDFCKYMQVSLPLYEHFVRYSHHVCNIQADRIKILACIGPTCASFIFWSMFRIQSSHTASYAVFLVPLLFADCNLILRAMSGTRIHHWREGTYQYFSEDWIGERGLKVMMYGPSLTSRIAQPEAAVSPCTLEYIFGYFTNTMWITVVMKRDVYDKNRWDMQGSVCQNCLSPVGIRTGSLLTRYPDIQALINFRVFWIIALNNSVE